MSDTDLKFASNGAKMREPQEAEQSRRPRATLRAARGPRQPFQGNPVTRSSTHLRGLVGFHTWPWGMVYAARSWT